MHWKDGQPWSERFDDRYFSVDSGLAETGHVFLQGNRLAERFAALRAGQVLRVGETGFGTGLNFLCTWQLFEQAAPAKAALEFHSVERHPLDTDDLRAALALWPQLCAPTLALCAAWPALAQGRPCWQPAGSRVQLRLDIDDVLSALAQWPDQHVDAWFFDGFAPAKNPQMWSPEVLAEAARASRLGATFATYTCAGWVRRGLQRAGFKVQRAPGFGSKREMLIGSVR